MRQCIDCGKTKPVSEYNLTYPRGREHKGWPRKRCKVCQNLRQRELREARFKEDPTKRKKYLANKRERRMAKYGLTESEFQELAKAQGYCCYTCGKKRQLHVDHNHTTGITRKLLCSPCNTSLGLVDEDVIVLNNLINYLKEHPC